MFLTALAASLPALFRFKIMTRFDLSTGSLLTNGIIHIPVNLIQMSWLIISVSKIPCGLALPVFYVKGLIFSPSKIVEKRRLLLYYIVH